MSTGQDAVTAAIHAGAAVPLLRRTAAVWLDDHAVHGRWPMRAVGVLDALRVLADAPDTAHLVRVPGIAGHRDLRAGLVAEVRELAGPDHERLLGPDRYAAVGYSVVTGEVLLSERFGPPEYVGRVAPVDPAALDAEPHGSSSGPADDRLALVDEMVHGAGWWHVNDVPCWHSPDGGRSWFGHVVPPSIRD